MQQREPTKLDTEIARERKKQRVVNRWTYSWIILVLSILTIAEAPTFSAAFTMGFCAGVSGMFLGISAVLEEDQLDLE